MSNDKGFTEEQKQFLSGFAFGTDVARAVSGLPVLSNSAGGGVNGESITIGAKAEDVLPVGPEKIALIAQRETKESGKQLCKEELAKLEKNPLDMWDEMQARSDKGEFPKGTDVFLQKFHGLFYVAPAQNSFMCRMRIPGGLLHAWQLTGLADLSDRSAGGYIDVTTRANLQYREIPADQAMNILYGLRELEIVNLGAGGDNIRNCTASPLSGIDTIELIETIPLAKRMHHYILNSREMYGLPRKFNIAFDGGGTISSLDDTNDIGFHAVSVSAENASAEFPEGVYFQLTLGGITGHKDFARPTGVLLRPDQCLAVAGAIVRVFVKHGDRTDRKKARLKYVLDDWGFDKFIAAVEEQLGYTLPRLDESKLTKSLVENRMAHIGFHPQAQTGKQYVGVVLPVGRITSDQARSLADIATKYGNGEIRLTVWQNLLIPNIDDANVEAVQQALLEIGLDYRASQFRAGLVACTGSGGCKFAAAETKTHAMILADHLQAQFDLDLPINIHLTGCHHSCAQHYIGDIGLIGCKVEKGDDMVDGYHVHLGGGWGERQGIARLIFESVAFEEMPNLISAVIQGYIEQRNDGETFVDFTARKTDDELKSLAAMSPV
ncbi:NirA family protein [Rhodopirellula sp. MGV]|uniref:NirA family protein n=1 Tax=Rhodopirellula sp. MGV TaxID=2023130 RepID=UPI000B9647C5|nr:NirA family protein [Rhodopirellula sp. MGV]OYP38214.1 ferredoxin--nitrite reductase [Rhodopirellula sp. MGV]PNY38551.1 ferredoxin--nitrite reductase [Rhodopirellula baltica]